MLYLTRTQADKYLRLSGSSSSSVTIVADAGIDKSQRRYVYMIRNLQTGRRQRKDTLADVALYMDETVTNVTRAFTKAKRDETVKFGHFEVTRYQRDN